MHRSNPLKFHWFIPIGVNQFLEPPGYGAHYRDLALKGLRARRHGSASHLDARPAFLTAPPLCPSLERRRTGDRGRTTCPARPTEQGTLRTAPGVAMIVFFTVLRAAAWTGPGTASAGPRS
ncbi:hypothetical protein GCM10010404_09980 [Nonomuraea africana]